MSSRFSDRKKVKTVSPPLKSNPQETKKCSEIKTVEGVHNSSIGNLLTTAYGVIKLILEQLDWPDLVNAAEVSREWKQVANVIFAERQCASWFHLIPGRKNRHSLHYHKHGQYSKPKLCLIFLNEFTGVPIPCRSLPEGSCVKGCKDEHRILSLVGVSIPEITGVKINNFSISRDNIDKNLLKSTIGADYQIKCLLTFFAFENRSSIISEQIVDLERFMSVIHQHQPKVRFAYGGGMVISTKESDFNQHFSRNDGKTLCITFSTKKNSHVDFNAYSLILWDNARDFEDVEPLIASLSKKAIRREHMAAFRFACISRNGMSEIEMGIFQRHFPDVPMIGIEGFGEMGLYCVPSDDQEMPDPKRPCTDRDFAHSDTTIIILICWGKRIA